MIGLFWNCRGVGKKGFMCLPWRASYIQETMKSSFSDAFFRGIDPWNQFSWNWLPSKGRSGGILGGVRTDRIEILQWFQGVFSIKLKVKDKKSLLDFFIICVYGPAQEEGKECFLQELVGLCCDQSLPVLIGGDFNILIFASDKNKDLRKSKWVDLFNSVIATHAMKDVTLTGDASPGPMGRSILLWKKLIEF